MKEGLRRRRLWCRRLGVDNGWMSADIPALLADEPGPSMAPAALKAHPVWRWASPEMRDGLAGLLAWHALSGPRQDNPYSHWLAAIEDGTWFGRDHTGGISVGTAWISLRDLNPYDRAAPFID